MGKTLQDIDKRFHNNQMSRGMSHKEILKLVPKSRRARFEKSIDMSDIQAHFGMKPWVFWLVLVLVITLTIIFGITVGQS